MTEGESCCLLWFWQPQHKCSVFSHPGYMVHTRHLLRKKTSLAKCWRNLPLLCLRKDMLFMIGEPGFCGNVLFYKTRRKKVLFCVKGLSRNAPEVKSSIH